jgi:hypothetical protein
VSDRTRPFVIVLIEVPSAVPRPLLRLGNALARMLAPFEHMGVGCASRDEMDRLCEQAKADGCLSRSPKDAGPPVGYWAFLTDPDRHTLELSYGQQVGLTVDHAHSASRSAKKLLPHAPERHEVDVLLARRPGTTGMTATTTWPLSSTATARTAPVLGQSRKRTRQMTVQSR